MSAPCRSLWWENIDSSTRELFQRYYFSIARRAELQALKFSKTLKEDLSRLYTKSNEMIHYQNEKYKHKKSFIAYQLYSINQWQERIYDLELAIKQFLVIPRIFKLSQEHRFSSKPFYDILMKHYDELWKGKVDCSFMKLTPPSDNDRKSYKVSIAKKYVEIARTFLRTATPLLCSIDSIGLKMNNRVESLHNRLNTFLTFFKSFKLTELWYNEEDYNKNIIKKKKEKPILTIEEEIDRERYLDDYYSCFGAYPKSSDDEDDDVDDTSNIGRWESLLSNWIGFGHYTIPTYNDSINTNTNRFSYCNSDDSNDSYNHSNNNNNDTTTAIESYNYYFSESIRIELLNYRNYLYIIQGKWCIDPCETLSSMYPTTVRIITYRVFGALMKDSSLCIHVDNYTSSMDKYVSGYYEDISRLYFITCKTLISNRHMKINSMENHELPLIRQGLIYLNELILLHDKDPKHEKCNNKIENRKKQLENLLKYYKLIAKFSLSTTLHYKLYLYALKCLDIKRKYVNNTQSSIQYGNTYDYKNIVVNLYSTILPSVYSLEEMFVNQICEVLAFEMDQEQVGNTSIQFDMIDRQFAGIECMIDRMTNLSRSIPQFNVNYDNYIFVYQPNNIKQELYYNQIISKMYYDEYLCIKNNYIILKYNNNEVCKYSQSVFNITERIMSAFSWLQVPILKDQDTSFEYKSFKIPTRVFDLTREDVNSPLDLFLQHYLIDSKLFRQLLCHMILNVYLAIPSTDPSSHNEEAIAMAMLSSIIDDNLGHSFRSFKASIHNLCRIVDQNYCSEDYSVIWHGDHIHNPNDIENFKPTGWHLVECCMFWMNAYLEIEMMRKGLSSYVLGCIEESFEWICERYLLVEDHMVYFSSALSSHWCSDPIDIETYPLNQLKLLAQSIALPPVECSKEVIELIESLNNDRTRVREILEAVAKTISEESLTS